MSAVLWQVVSIMSEPYKQCITGMPSIRVTAGYPLYPSGSVHGGIDTVHGDHRAYAPKAGRVVVAHTWQGGTTGVDSWGNYIVVEFADREYWLAAHFTEQLHHIGETLEAGEFIGIQGITGNVTGVHTHWEYWSGGANTNYRQDPSPIIGIPNAVGTYPVTWDTGSGPGPGPTPVGSIPIWLLFKIKGR